MLSLMNSLTTSSRHSVVTFGLLSIVALASFAPADAMAQQNQQKIRIVDTIWGFDGRIQAGHFNPVTILLDNTTADAIDGTLNLSSGSGLIGSKVAYQAPVFLSPNARRWIQLYPYIPESYSTSWRLQLQDNKSSKRWSLGKVPQPRIIQQQNSNNDLSKISQKIQGIVILPGDSRAKTPSILRRFPEEVFPAYVTATTPLHSVFLDDQPDWEEPRQQAFMNWVHLGGQVHLLKNRRGEYPEFTGTMSELSQPMSGYNIGAGRVRKHEQNLAELTDDDVERIYRNSELLDRRFQQSFEEAQLEDAQQNFGLMDSSPSVLDMELFRLMQERTRPDHAWWLIFLLAFVYILLIFPGCYLLSKNRQLHFLTTYAAIAGLSVLFSIIFLFIGRRGYGESTWLQSLAVARVTDKGGMLVDQWSSLFVTNGDNYTINSPDSQSLYSIGVENDNSFGAVTPGKEGVAAIRIPPYSAQTLCASRFLQSTAWNLKVIEKEFSGNQLTRLTIQTDDSFPQFGALHKYHVISGNRILQLQYDSDDKTLSLFGVRRSLQDFCQVERQYRFMTWAAKNTNDDREEEEIYVDEILPLLVQRSILAEKVPQPEFFQLPPNRLRLLVMTGMDADNDLQVSQNHKHSGWVLYTHDLILE